MARKYTAELMVGVMAYAYVLVRPRELSQVDVPKADETHIYLIGVRPRVSILDSSVVLRPDGFSATCQTSIGGSHRRFQVSVDYDLGAGVFYESSYPFTDFSIRKFGDPEPILTGTAVNLASIGARGFPEDCSHFRVLYVGKAFGTAGERSSIERLKTHATLQKILAEVTPDLEVWLILARIDDLTLMGGINPSGAGWVGEDEEASHYAEALGWLHSDVARRKEAVDLAEAGLIRFFEPEYNVQLKSTFPEDGQAALRTLNRFDLHAVAVELQAQHLGVLVGSGVTDLGNWHAQSFAVHFDQTRGPFLEVFEPLGQRQSMVLRASTPRS